jgi:hypothetical protein
VVLFKLKISKEQKWFQIEEGFGKDQGYMQNTMNQQLTRINTKALSALGRVLRTRPCYWRYMFFV